MDVVRRAGEPDVRAGAAAASRALSPPGPAPAAPFAPEPLPSREVAPPNSTSIAAPSRSTTLPASSTNLPRIAVSECPQRIPGLFPADPELVAPFSRSLSTPYANGLATGDLRMLPGPAPAPPPPFMVARAETDNEPRRENHHGDHGDTNNEREKRRRRRRRRG